ncbi:TrbC/VirB2 family protein [Xenorhabdus eapokensis]|uniref:Conjugal transfer protein TrbC n=1 Tax=Xenorhabdus eapokensis TaxID=1873482 RepID=A0A1Q5TKR9_9GAMM|nr:TrbC/VirB2 family protein [Xenorhabdus eapokensis]OKP00816.1 conjugal transfer protein TrbC [Xenorhabdus eapokensis]
MIAPTRISLLTLNIRAVLRNPYFWLALAVFIFLLTMHPAHASDATEGGGAGLPWEGPLAKLKQSFSGPVAFVIALLGIIACGATLIWGGEVSEFTRRIIYVVLVVCLIVFANTLLTGALFSGAVVPPDAAVSPADLKTYTKTHTASLSGMGGHAWKP